MTPLLTISCKYDAPVLEIIWQLGNMYLLCTHLFTSFISYYIPVYIHTLIYHANKLVTLLHCAAPHDPF